MTRAAARPDEPVPFVLTPAAQRLLAAPIEAPDIDCEPFDERRIHHHPEHWREQTR